MKMSIFVLDRLINSHYRPSDTYQCILSTQPVKKPPVPLLSSSWRQCTDSRPLCS